MYKRNVIKHHIHLCNVTKVIYTNITWKNYFFKIKNVSYFQKCLLFFYLFLNLNLRIKSYTQRKSTDKK